MDRSPGNTAPNRRSSGRCLDDHHPRSHRRECRPGALPGNRPPAEHTDLVMWALTVRSCGQVTVCPGIAIASIDAGVGETLGEMLSYVVDLADGVRRGLTTPHIRLID